MANKEDKLDEETDKKESEELPRRRLSTALENLHIEDTEKKQKIKETKKEDSIEEIVESSPERVGHKEITFLGSDVEIVEQEPKRDDDNNFNAAPAEENPEKNPTILYATDTSKYAGTVPKDYETQVSSKDSAYPEQIVRVINTGGRDFVMRAAQAPLVGNLRQGGLLRSEDSMGWNNAPSGGWNDEDKQYDSTIQTNTKRRKD